MPAFHMIISASRRTDIPSFYPEWFFNRIREKYVLVPNPFNPRQVSRIQLTPEVVDCIVFWTKNPAPLLKRLSGLKDFNYYFQYTITPYTTEIEHHLPDLRQRIETFRCLSDLIGREKVIWRYDPILVNEKYTLDFHKSAFAYIASRLAGYTEKCMLGFIDHYKHILTATNQLHIGSPCPTDIREMALAFKQNLPSDMQLNTCTVKNDLSEVGIPAGKCIDKELIEKITGYPISARKDRNQRDVCCCIESIDIGTYDTCLNGCIYCYANTAKHKPLRNIKLHDPQSPKLVGYPNENDIIKDRKMYSLRNNPGGD